MKKSIVVVLTVLCIFVSGRPLEASATTSEMIDDAIEKMLPTLKTIPAGLRKVAIYSIEPDREKKINISSLQDQITTALLETGRFSVIDRKTLKSLLEEQRLSMTGAVEPTQMIKAGKLVGIQGFFYGSVEVSKENVVLNLKLIDVESSAIVYARKFTGESYSFGRISFGIGTFSPLKMGNEFSIWVDDSGNLTEIESERKKMDGLTASRFNFSLSYKQGSKTLKWAQFGVDFNIGMGGEIEGGHAKSKGDLYYPVAGTNFGYEHWTSLTYFFITPKLYISGKSLFGPKFASLNPYLGLFVGNISINFKTSAWGGNSGESEESYSQEFNIISPVIGFEFNMTKSLSIYAEGMNFPKKEAKEPMIGYLGGIQANNTSHIDKGMNFNIGVKYYINLF